MSILSRNSDAKSLFKSDRVFFVTTRCWGGRALLQSDRMAKLFISVLYHYRAQERYRLHAFVVMPNHVHLLLSLEADMAIEKVAQLVKGGFSFRAAKELGFRGEIWQRGFSEMRIRDSKNLAAHHRYIHENPVRTHLVDSASEYPYSSAHAGYELDTCAKFSREEWL